MYIIWFALPLWGHVWTAPFWQGVVWIWCKLVECSHVSGLLMAQSKALRGWPTLIFIKVRHFRRCYFIIDPEQVLVGAQSVTRSLFRVALPVSFSTKASGNRF